MSSPINNLQKGKKLPLIQSGSRAAPFKKRVIPEDEFISQFLKQHAADGENRTLGKAEIPTNHDLLSSMINRLSNVEKKLLEHENTIKEKDKRIKVLEEKCEIYKKAQGYGSDQVDQLKQKCHKLQNQVHSMEDFLEDYGMIWVGKNDSDTESDFEKEDLNVVHNDCTITRNEFETVTKDGMWNPDSSLINGRRFVMDFDLVMKNIQELNEIAGEGEHIIKHTRDGATLQVRDSVSLTLYKNGIFMFNGPFRPYDDVSTQTCMKDVMDGYFPSELQPYFPDGVPFKVIDKREVNYEDKHLNKLFPGQGYALSPEKQNYSVAKDHNIIQHRDLEMKKAGYRQSVDSFLSRLPASVIKQGKVIDIRDSLRETLQEAQSVNDVVVIETEAMKGIKQRLSSGCRSRPQSSSNVTTLRIKSPAGDRTFILKMKYTETIRDVRDYLNTLQDLKNSSYDLKTSFPSQLYTHENKTLQEYGLVPNANLHVILRRKEQGTEPI